MSESREIPNGWALVKLGDVCSFEYGKALKAANRNKEGKFPVLGSNGCVGFHDTYLVNGPGVVIGRKGAAGEISFVGKNFWPIDTTYFLKLNKDLSLLYFYFLLKSLRLNQFEKSTAIPGLNRNDAYDQIFPFPPLPEQHRIVAKIEELFSSLDKGIESLKTAQQQLKVYRQAVLKWAFEGKLTGEWRRRQGNLHTADDLLKQIQAEKEKEAKSSGKKLKPTNSLSNEREANLPQLPISWKWVSLGEIISDLTDYHANGSYLKMKENVQLIDTPEYAIMIRATNFEKENFKTDLKYITEDAYNFLARSKLFGGEILIGKIGNAGKVYFMPNLNKPASLAMNLFALRFNVDVNKYIHYHLLSLFSKQQISSYVKGVGNPTIDKNSVRSLSIALPSYEEQQHIVEELESRLTVCDKIEESIEHSLKQSEALRQSILKKAFEGKLVPQNPNDEPASVLLDRIKSEREKNKPETPPRRQAGKTKKAKS
jgi:type I restriction enzyme S subunit